LPTPSPPSKFWQNPPVVDGPVVQDASYRMNKADRAYIDSQILAVQSKVAGLLAAPPPPPAYWTPGGPLVYSPVDIINAVANIEGSAVFDINALNMSVSIPFFAATGLRYCNGVRFVWASGHATTVSVRLWSGMSNSSGTSIAHVTQVVGASAGVYTVLFGNNYILSNGKSYAVSVYDTDPTSSGTHWACYTKTTGGDGTTWTNFFGNAGGNQLITLAPGVFIGQIPGLGSYNPLTNYGFGGDNVPNNSGGGHGFNAIEPILQ
jgi:hypothetical protein